MLRSKDIIKAFSIKTVCFLILFLAIACTKQDPYDDSNLITAISGLRERLSELESLLNAVDNKLTVLSITEDEGTYSIRFSDNSSITITSGKDGETLIDNISIDNNYVYFSLSDGRMFSLPLLQKLDFILADGYEKLLMAPGQTRNIPYYVVSTLDDITIQVLTSFDVKAAIVNESSDLRRGEIHVETGESLDEYSKIVVLISNGERLIMKTLTFAENGIDLSDNANLFAYQRAQNFVLDFVATDDYEVLIPESATSWLTIIETKSLSKRSVTFHLEKNTGTYREADVVIRLISTGDSVTFHVEQRADPAIAKETSISVLRDIYNSFNGDKWPEELKSGWFSDAPLNSWNGVSADSYGNITSLELSTYKIGSYSIGGTLPPSIGQLKCLRSMRLYTAYVSEIPKEIGNLKQLEYLNVCAFEKEKTLKTVPQEISNCSKLKTLYLSGHNFVEVPDAIYALDNLENLGLNNSGLSGELKPGLSRLKKLQKLALGVNELTGGIPQEIFELRLLRELALDRNPSLGGTIPSSFSSMDELEVLDLYSCGLTGQIPSSLGNCRKLKELNLGSNNLTGMLPASLSFIEKLDVSRNKLSGSIPDSFFETEWINDRWGYLFDGNNFDTIDMSRLSVPDFYLGERTNPEERTFSVRDACLSNKVTILVYWSAACTYSEGVLIRISNLYNKYHDKGLEVISWSSAFDIDNDMILFDSVGAMWTNRYSAYFGYPINIGMVTPQVTIFDSNGVMIYCDRLDEEEHRGGMEKAIENFNWR